jgi:hypothetical protein
VTSRLKFYEKSHRYRLDGEWTPSVTGIINGGTPKGALLNWYAEKAAECAKLHRFNDDLTDDEFFELAKSAPNRDRDAAAGQGTAVHSFAERMAEGDITDPPPEAIAGHVEQAALFMREWRPKFLHTEVKLFHEHHHWCGTADFIAEIDGLGVVVGDYKTNRSGLYATELSLQLAAYANATHMVLGDEDVAMPAVDGCIAVWIGPDSYEVRQIDGGDNTYRYFRYVHQTYLWCKKLAKAAMSDPLAPAMQEAS